MGLRLDDLTTRQLDHPGEPSRRFLDLLLDYDSSQCAGIIHAIWTARERLLATTEDDYLVTTTTFLLILGTQHVDKLEALGTYVRSLEDEVRKLQSTIVDLTTK